MKWIGISGTWRTTDKDVEMRVRKVVREILARGDGIITGGATGVDYFATDEALRVAPDASKVKIAIPSTLENYIEHLKLWADGYETGDPSVSQAEVDRLISQLHSVQSVNPTAIIEGPSVAAQDICQNDYNARDIVVAQVSRELVAFQVNKSKGTEHTISKAMTAGKAITLLSFTVENDKAYGKITSPKSF